MPPKKRTAFTSQTLAAKRNREDARIRRANTTANYSEEERLVANERLCLNRQRHRQNYNDRSRDVALNRQSRQNETPEQSSSRRISDAQNHAIRRTGPRATNSIAVSFDFNEDSVDEHYCGKMDTICIFCNARHFEKELPADKKFTVCCQKGKVKLDPIRTHDLIKGLMLGSHLYSKNFKENIRSFNSSLAFASMGASIVKLGGYGPYCFKIHGQIYHRVGALHPENDNENRTFAQLYIHDPDQATEQRLRITENSKCNPILMGDLSRLMTEINPFAEACKMLHDVEQESIVEARLNGVEPKPILMAIRNDRKSDPRRYNAPMVTQVAAIFQNEDGEPPFKRDILIHCKSSSNNKKTQRVNNLDPNLDPLTYPLLFPFGDQSWGVDLPLNKTPNVLRNITNQATFSRKNISQMEYFSYRFQDRGDFNPFLSAGKLTQQYFVDAYVKMEANRLNFHRQKQSTLRIENYKQLKNYVGSKAQSEGLAAGVPVVLPSSFPLSPRNMQQNYEDAMAIVRKYGKPDLFITMTCNPKWKEITENLKPGESHEFRPDLVARVFNLKLKELLHQIKEKHIFGRPDAIVHVIEFQKRGLPHAHILLILKQEDKLDEIDKIDKIVWAEIPDPQRYPKLHAIVTKHMIHGPCGGNVLKSPCYGEDGKCSKEFPKDFQCETLANFKGYPKYKRRNDGKTYTVNNKIINNQWVVPFNPFLSCKFNCHINVEVCASISSVKYLFKYVYKGHDCANVEISEGTLQHNEIDNYVNSRYVSSPEAAWRIFGFRMHEQSHSIIRLAVHLPDQQSVTFEEENIEEAIESAENRDSNLTAWFKLNQQDSAAREYLYSDIPIHYTFEAKRRIWKPRLRGANRTIGRMHNANLNADPERYFLRLLLLHIKGATSFEDLRTHDGVLYDTFQLAAVARGLVHDEEIWEQTLADATVSSMPRQLRELFALICVFGNPSNILGLWEKYKDHFIEDYARHDGHNADCRICENIALKNIEDILISHGKYCSNYNLPSPTGDVSLATAEFFDAAAENSAYQVMNSTLNAEQQSAFDTIKNAIDNENLQGRCFFLDGPGGSGKTYLYRTLMSYVRGKGKIALPVASTGIAANLLEGGRTSHSQFGIPVKLHEDSVSNLPNNSNEIDLIRKAEILIWDESTMATNHSLKVVDKLLKKIMKSNLPFGNKVLLLGGDFRQTLPVVPHGSRSKIVEASIKFCRLWRFFTTLKLVSNVRSVDPNYSEWLMKLGDGKLTNSDDLSEDYIEIPSELLAEKDIVTEVFGEKLTPDQVMQFSKMAILCPKNEHVHQINEKVLSILEGEKVTYYSTDTIKGGTDNDNRNFPTEFLNNLTPSGMSQHILNLKKGAIIMLLRNLNTKRGLCNGTRLIVRDLKPNLIIAEALTGSAKGQAVFIPRIDLQPTNLDLPFVLSRRQFPVRLAFAITINKSQGQTLEKVGIYLPEPVFGHGQLYVACSRVKRACDVKIQIIDSDKHGKLIPGADKVFTKNVVYKEIFCLN